METVVDVSTVTKTYRTPEKQTVEALKEVSLKIPAGRFTTLLGPSGCGKTTLLRMIGGFEQPDEGDIFIDGKSMRGVTADKRPTNTVFQHYGLFPHMTVGCNVAYGLEVTGAPKADIGRRVGEALEMVRLGDFAGRRIAQLSGGQQQRVALARAIVLRPKVLLLDEPMAALDRQLRKEMQFELKRLQHELGIAFLCVTHDQEEALSMSDIVVVMNKGRVAQIGDPKSIYDDPQSEFVAGFVGEISAFKGKVTARDGALTQVTLASGASLLTAHKIDDTDTLFIRPERLHLAGADNARPTITGRLLQSVFVGSSTRLEVDMGKGELVVAMVSGLTKLPDNAEICLAYDPADVRPIRAQPAEL
ncbi:ABC transporter ATP-binding protein [Rhizobium sp.]|uniref:ABC transporter ATP-binding protein n=1 Tax=Rhizobium sp. TaxID=391 RepID=UPI002AA8F851